MKERRGVRTGGNRRIHRGSHMAKGRAKDQGRTVTLLHNGVYPNNPAFFFAPPLLLLVLFCLFCFAFSFLFLFSYGRLFRGVVFFLFFFSFSLPFCSLLFSFCSLLFSFCSLF